MPMPRVIIFGALKAQPQTLSWHKRLLDYAFILPEAPARARAARSSGTLKHAITAFCAASSMRYCRFIAGRRWRRRFHGVYVP